MVIVLTIILAISVLALAHSYAFFPLILSLLAKWKTPNPNVYDSKDDLPDVSIIMAVYNEERVLDEKIQSILASEYPKHKIEILIGSDASTDNTEQIIESYIKENNNINIVRYDKRMGKIGIINNLSQKAHSQILIITDANVIFEAQTIFQLIKHFKNEEIALVDSHMNNTGLSREGISVQERSYIRREVHIKYYEGLLWGCMMGPFGGCYAVRKSHFCPIPVNFLVDDFYVNMKVLEKGGKAINELEADVFEDVSNDLSEEFRRKIRIATGNFQNLNTFKHFLLRPFNPISFCLLSHKVLRWLGPFFLITALLSNYLLYSEYIIFKYLFIFQVILLTGPLIDAFFRKINIHNVILRFLTHFYSMNLALLIGFYKYIKGVKSNVWEPTKRKQLQS